jgi:1-acyl-sn-glycerol-3-phosphate acyltransferase
VWRTARVTVHIVEGLATTALVFPLLRPSTRRRLIRRWSGRLLRMLAIEARVHGNLPPSGGNLLVVSNHVSWLDVVVLHSVQPVRFIAKSDLARWPLAGRLIRDSGTLFVERERRRDTHRVNRQAAAALAAGDVVAVFPEGTTTDGTTMLPFKSSLLQPIVDAEGHVLPVAIRYRAADGTPSTAPAYDGDTSLVDSFRAVVRERRLVVELHLAAPLSASTMHRRELTRAAETAVREALGLPAAGRGTDPAAEPATRSGAGSAT